MLKITAIHADSGGITLTLEGSLSDYGVELLRDTHARHRQNGSSSLKLDLAAVSFVSPEGVAALRDLQANGVTCVGWTPFLSELYRGTP